MADETLTDLELFDGWRRGDTALGKLFFRRYAPKIMGYFRRNVYDRAQIEELVQDTFLECLKVSKQVEVTNPRAYLFGIAAHLFCRYIRRRRHEPEPIDGELGGEEPIHALDPDPEYVRLQADEDRLFMKAMRRLPFPQQVVLELSFWEEMSGREIAEVLKLPEGTVRGRIRLGRAALKRLLKELQESPEQFQTATVSFRSWQTKVHEYMAGLDPDWDKDDDDPRQ